MNVNLNKSKFIEIENRFATLKEVIDIYHRNPGAADISDLDTRVRGISGDIGNILEDIFKGLKFNVVVTNEHEGNLFIMSVFPETDTISKIINAVITNKTDKVISDLWKKNTNWTIEIDRDILINRSEPINFDEKELTALLLHEMGHVIVTNSIPSRISTIMKYEIAKANYSSKGMLANTVFAKILSLPILDSCISDKSRSMDNVKEEIKADNFARKMGYSNDLYSALTKISKSDKIKSNRDKDIASLTNMSIDTLNQIQQRRENIAKNTLIKLHESVSSPYISNVIGEYIHDIFENESYSKYPEGHKIEIVQEKMDESIDSYIKETFGVKDLKKIDPVSIDYIQVQISSIHNENDKMMLLTYAYSKLDLVNYYLDILDNPKLSKRYYIPNSREQLLMFKKRINDSIGKILSYKYPDKYKGILVAWPTGYEG